MRQSRRRLPSGRGVGAHRWFFPAALILAIADPALDGGLRGLDHLAASGFPAATAGVLYRRDQNLKSRVQPNLERSTLAALLVLAAADLLTIRAVAGAAAVLGGVLSAIRLVRWRPWAILDRPDLWNLHLGYGLRPGSSPRGWPLCSTARCSLIFSTRSPSAASAR